MMWPTKKPGAGGLSTVQSGFAPVVPASPMTLVSSPEPDAAAETRADKHTDLKVELHQKLIDRINLGALETMSRDQVGREIGEIVSEMLKELNHALNRDERRDLVEDILDELLGLGPLEPLLKDPTITDIMVNTYATVFVERRGKLVETRTRFKDDKHLLRIIAKIVAAVGRRVDESSPMVDARLPDGSRINAIIPPLAVDGPILSIRKFSKTPIDLDKLVSYGSMPPQAATVMRAVVAARRNLLISGGTGSGKTTMLNAVSASIDPDERIVTIEDSAELQLQQHHVVRLETRPPNIEGRGEINQRDLVRNALRMRPDRIILGECRAGEAFDMLQAMNTGHDGSMTTVHANTPRDALSRIEQMIGMSGIDVSPKSARNQIASAIHVIMQLERLSDGKRRVTSISEVTGMEGEVVLMQEIFRFRRMGLGANNEVLGQFEPTGIRPKFMEHLQARGLDLPNSLFDPNRGFDLTA